MLDQEVVLTPFGPGDGLPLFIQPQDVGLRESPEVALRWFHDNRGALEDLLSEAGALVFRGFPVPTTAAFSAWFEPYEAPRFGYMAGAAPRLELAPRVFESTRVPSGEVLGLHQEMAYLPTYPGKVAFYARTPSVTGGETFIADMRRVSADLDPAFVEAVAERGVLYTRNFRDRNAPTGSGYFDLIHRTWQDAFGEDRDQPLRDCEAMELKGEWLSDGSLSTTYLAPGLVAHPRTGERIWFNQISTQVQGPLTKPVNWPLYEQHYAGGKPLPYDATFGDGERFPDPFLKSLFVALERHQVAFPWSAGDVLFLDNLTTAHGRNAFTGLRDIQVALMA